MSKKTKRWKESVPIEIVEEAIDTKPAEEIYLIAKTVCGIEPCVIHYDHEGSRYYKDGQLLRKALKKCLVAGAFNHRATIINMLELGR